MTLTKGHNNLTKLNEKTSCICGNVFKHVTHMALDENFISPRNFIFFERNTPDIKHHVEEVHSNSFPPYHNPQQPRFEFCFFATHKFQV